MNQFRLDCVRVLRQHFPKHALAGVEDSPFAREVCPDLVLNSDETSWKSYFKRIKSTAIGIATNGLHQSIGWKMGEYIAASRAIITERPYFLFPPHFLEGQNYLSFSTPDELCATVDSLLSRPNSIQCMMKENQLYYDKYQRPDRLVLNILNQITE